MILVCAPPDDRWAALTVRVLQQRRTEVIALTNDDFFAHAGVSWLLDPPQNQSLLTCKGARISAAGLSGVLVRIRPPIATALETTGPEEQYVAVERHAFLVAWLHALPCRVINRPRPGPERSLVPSQATIQRLASCGFQLPPVLVTSSVTHALEFYERTCRRALVTSLASPRSRVISGDEGRRDLRALVTRHPVRLEAMPEGEALVVLTVGARAFRAATPIDRVPRTVQNESTPVTALSPELAARCCELARVCGLEFAELHLVLGDLVYCLEIAAWPTSDDAAAPLQHEVAAALADRLAGSSGPLAEDVSRISHAPQGPKPTFVP